MSANDAANPNNRKYAAPGGGSYLSTRILTHAGTTIAFALGRTKDSSSLFIDYSILNSEEQQQNSSTDKDASWKPNEKLDSQTWFDDAKTLRFASEIRVVGEEAVPVYEIPSVDRTGRSVGRDEVEKLDLWRSTSLSFMDPDTTNFEVVSDGKYIYVFRQSRAKDAELPNPLITKARPPIDRNLLCDRFTLVGSGLNRALEVRYRRSRQKRLPLNEKDTLAVQDINDKLFYEPTFSLRFISDLLDGRFTIIRAPSMANEVYKWQIFAYSDLTKHIECYTIDAAVDGLFDIHGQIYYTCDNPNHKDIKIFTTIPGACTAEAQGRTCGKSKTPLLPKPLLSERALTLSKEKLNASLVPKEPIDFSKPEFAQGFTIEAWIKVVPFWIEGETTEDDSEESDDTSPPSESLFSLFLFASEPGGKVCSVPSIYLNEELKLTLQRRSDDSVLETSDAAVKVNRWTHIAVSYRPGQVAMIVNGEHWKSYEHSSGPFSARLERIASQTGAPDRRFRGQLDEIRLWSYPLYSGTVKDRMGKRATGSEPFLEACWHLDEGVGTKAYDATLKRRDLEIQLKDAASMAPDIWTKSTAPVLGNFGLTRKSIRLPSSFNVAGGLSASVYFEQVSVTSKTTTGASESKEGQEVKPLKRNARVLLSFVAESAEKPETSLAVIDFALLSGGCLCDWPAVIPLSTLSLKTPPGQVRARASTTLLHVDPQGMELYGGVLHVDTARSSKDAPCVWDSATGSITIFYRGSNKILSALTYDVSRTIVANEVVFLSGHSGLMASSKLRQAESVIIDSQPCEWASPQRLIDLVLTAVMENGSKIQERWRGIPASRRGIINALSGASYADSWTIGTFAALQQPEVNGSAKEEDFRTYEYIMMEAPLREAIPVGTCIQLAKRRYQVIQEGKANDQYLIVSTPYYTPKGTVVEPKVGADVIALGYDYMELPKVTGKNAGDFSQGSSILTLNLMSGDDGSGLIDLEKQSFISGRGQSPFFTSPPPSSALKTHNGATDTVYTMLESVATTGASPGISFESWIRVNDITESVIVAYQSERLPRSERADTESQTFVLAIPDASASEYELVGNANGTLFRVTDAKALRKEKWVHFACSLHNTLALRFSGSNYVDLGTAVEWNVANFALAFTIQLHSTGTERLILAKAAAFNRSTPLLVKVLANGVVCLCYWAGEEDGSNVRERWVTSPEGTPLVAGQAYKIFISRNMLRVKKPDYSQRSVQVVTMKAWRADDTVAFEVKPPTPIELEEGEKKSNNPFLGQNGPAIACGVAQGNEEALTLGGADWTTNWDRGLHGTVSAIRLYSSAINVPSTGTVFSSVDKSDRSLIASFSFKGDETAALMNDVGSNHGKLRKEPTWVVSPFKPDHQLSIFINGSKTQASIASPRPALRSPVGPHQLTLGNVMHGDDVTRFLAMEKNFHGEFDEFRIWNVPRTRENFTDALNARLSEVPPSIAVYLPFDDVEAEIASGEAPSHSDILNDVSINCWHLSPIFGGAVYKVPSQAPVGHDAYCVRHVLGGNETSGASISSRPSVAEYGDLQQSADGGMEGSYKRAYGYICSENHWNLDTGFRIGTLLTEWVSQVQTSPTLIGYIEGAPPIPAENFADRDVRPNTSIRFQNAKRCVYSYGLRKERGTDFDLTVSTGMGAKWQTSAGIGVQSEITAGEVKGAFKRVLDISSAQISNNMSTSTTNTNLEMKMELTGTWNAAGANGADAYEPSNTGLALVESEVADVFALRLKMRGPVAPLVAYQMKPNPDIPKDRNLVSFEINKAYTKQGCLDGRYGGVADASYPNSTEAPKDASYYKPVEAYALKERIRRAQEQLQGEHDQYEFSALGQVASAAKNFIGLGDKTKLPSRTSRNICNTYVWTADGGTFQESTSVMDFTSAEVGGNANFRMAAGGSFDMELSFASALVTANVDALLSSHTQIMQTKEVSSDTSFELIADHPPPVEIRQLDPNTNTYAKRAGAVDAYRWMSFWLEPSTEGTDAFFQRVIDPLWLEESIEPNARLLRELRESLSRQAGNARTKAWRVLHRCTYVSRVREKVPASIQAAAAAASMEQTLKKKGTLLADVACNWLIIQRLEPLVRAAKDKREIAEACRVQVEEWYPTVRANQKLYAQLIDLLADYIGVE